MSRSPLRDVYHLTRSLATRQPFIIARDWVPKMAHLMRDVIDQDGPFDAIHADQLWMAPYALWAQKLSSNGHHKVVLDQHNAVYMIPQRLSDGERNLAKIALLKLEAQKMARFETETCRQFDDVVWVTQEDFDSVQQIASLPIPNSSVTPICSDPEDTSVIVRKPDARRVTFLGGLHYPPNAQGVCWFAEHTLPQILREVPDAVFTVIGKQPPDLTKYKIPEKNLDITGFVDDPVPYLQETAAFVVPLQAGGGMRVKILDAWTWGMPMVSTSIGAEGIQIQDGENIIIADTPAHFAQSVIQLLKQPQLQNDLAKQGRKWVEQQYNWRITYKNWDTIYHS
ncbi:glycosyltransferase family 4 protein [Chloroflexi bacterium TSY]|nr:glycosyltransferase family 4 protein [Chloroflexi bacterium TSY]